MVAKRYASHSAIADHHPAAILRPRAVLVLCQCVCGDGSGSNSDSQFVVATSTYLSDPGRSLLHPRASMPHIRDIRDVP